MKKVFVLFILTAMMLSSACTNQTVTDVPIKKTVKTDGTSTGGVTKKEEPEKVDESWKECYANYLVETKMESDAGAMYYEKGDGRFALKDMNGDKIPELFVIDMAGTSLIYTYDKENDKVTLFSLAEGSSDLPYRMFYELMFGDDGTFMDVGEGYMTYWVVPKNENYEFAVKFAAGVENGKYYYKEYDVERMCEEGYDYRINEPYDEITAEEYEKLKEEYIYDNSECSIIEDVYKITEEDVKAILG